MIRNMRISKSWSFLGLGVALASSAWMGSAANASLVVELRAADGSKSAQVNAGQTITLNIFGTVTANNVGGSFPANGVTDESLSVAIGSFIDRSNSTGPSGSFGQVTISTPFNGGLPQKGTLQNIAGTGPGGDVGTSNSAGRLTSDFVRFDSGTTPITVANAGAGNARALPGNVDASEFLLGTVTWTASATIPATGTTSLGFVPRLQTTGSNDQNGALWTENGTGPSQRNDPTLAPFTAGTDVAITPVPEPTGLAAVSIGLMGLLAHRRRNA